MLFVGGKTNPDEENAILCDYRYSATHAVEHLYTLGHRDIAFFSYGPDNLTIRQKEDGFTEEMKKCGLPPKIFRAGNASDTLLAGSELTKLLIDGGTLPTAIWCASDLMAVGVLNTLKAHGISVPGDVSVIGHDDLYFDVFPGIGLTTLHTPMREIGKAAVELAIALTNHDDSTEHRSVFQTMLVQRSTTASAPTKKSV